VSGSEPSNQELERLREDSLLLHQILASRSWRWTRPFRFLARLARHRGLAPEDRRWLRLLFRRLGRRIPYFGARLAAAPLPAMAAVARPVEELLPAVELERLELRPAAQGDKPDIYMWAVIDWHFRLQRPQHLARALAMAGHRVYYMSNNFIDSPHPGFAIEPLDGSGRLFQVHLHLAGAPAIYACPPTPAQSAQLAQGLLRFAHWHQGTGAVSIVSIRTGPYLRRGRPRTGSYTTAWTTTPASPTTRPASWPKRSA
jgi:hypothetical protein